MLADCLKINLEMSVPFCIKFSSGYWRMIFQLISTLFSTGKTGVMNKFSTGFPQKMLKVEYKLSTQIRTFHTLFNISTTFNIAFFHTLLKLLKTCWKFVEKLKVFHIFFNNLSTLIQHFNIRKSFQLFNKFSILAMLKT